MLSDLCGSRPIAGILTLRRKLYSRLRWAAALAPVLAALMLTKAQAQEHQDYYAGKTLRFIVGVAAGGGFDAYGRLLASHLPRFIPGKPTVVVQNMPGAGSVLMANYLYSPTAPRDGTVIGLGGGNLLTAGLFGAFGARFDSRQFFWIGSMNAEAGVSIAWHTSPVTTASDLFERELVVGAAGLNAASALYPSMLNRVLGTKYKVVPGYSGSAETMLAMERGEVQGVGYANYSWISSGKPEWLREKKISLILQYALTRHPELPNLPTVLDLAKTKAQRDILSLILVQISVGRPVFGPPNMDAEPSAILRKAFATLLQDPEFLADAKKRNLEITDPLNGERISSLIANLYDTDPVLIKQAAEAVSPTKKK